MSKTRPSAPNEYRYKDSWGIEVVSAAWADYMLAAANELLDQENCPREYVKIGDTGPIYCLHGTSSISAFHALQEKLSEVTAANQARIDALMMEYCPDEMTGEQITNWQSHQREATE